MKIFLSLLLALLVMTACTNSTDAPPPPVANVAGEAEAAASSVDPSVADAADSQATSTQVSGAATEVPNRLVIPQLELDTPVVELGWSTGTGSDGYVFSQWEVANNAAGWHKNSAELGEPGNIVMSGHNNILGAVFRELDQLRQDDEITVYSADESVDYVVERVLIVPEKRATPEQREDNAQWITQMGDDRLTLVSCWPRDNNTHRIIVIAKPATGAVSSQ